MGAGWPTSRKVGPVDTSKHVQQMTSGDRTADPRPKPTSAAPPPPKYLLIVVVVVVVVVVSSR